MPIKEVQFTLYDVFGFLVPGTIVLAALTLFFSTAYLPAVPVPYTAPDLLGWVVSGVLVYFGGHMAQSLGNLTERLFVPTEDIVLSGDHSTYRLDDQVIAACKAKVRDVLKVEPEGMKGKWLFRLCDDAVIRSGKIGEREIYVYREGFYRGSAIAFALLALASLVLAARLYIAHALSLEDVDWNQERPAFWIVAAGSLTAAGVCYFLRSWNRCFPWLAVTFAGAGTACLLTALPRYFAGHHPIDTHGWSEYREFLWFVFVVALGCSYLSFRRYRRFGMYRVTHAMMGFLTVKDDKQEEKRTTDTAAGEPARA
jgi:hypothetical protein